MTIDVTFVIFFFIFRMFPNTFNYIDVSMSVLEYKLYLSTFTFQPPSNETPWGSISCARGVSFPKHSFTRSFAYGLYTWFTRHNQMDAYLGRSYVHTLVVFLRLIIINWPIYHIVAWTIVTNKISFDAKKYSLWYFIRTMLFYNV
jgi:hypothetical protein